MAVQVSTSALIQSLGNRIAGANEQHKDKPVEVGFQRLPPGIKDGIAKLQVCEWGQYKDDKMGQGMKGKYWYRWAAVVVYPIMHNGEKVAGRQTSQIVPMCDVPAKGQRKATSFEDNFFDYQNYFKSFGVPPCPHTKATDASGAKTIAYFDAAAKTLTAPNRQGGPVYISFATRGWTPPRPANAKPNDPDPEMMVFEEWYGLATPEQIAKMNTSFNPAMGVGSSNGQSQPVTSEVFEEPPTGVVDPRSLPDTDSSDEEITDEYITQLVAIAMDDPAGETEEGADACKKLEDLAWSVGWTEEDTNAEGVTWEQVGDMILNPRQEDQNPEEETAKFNHAGPLVGAKHNFTKRDSKGEKLIGRNKKPFPPIEVVVTSVDTENMTCTVKSASDGKDVKDVRTGKPVVVKWEWLE